MTSAALELQGAIVARLKAFAPLAAFVAGRVYDRIPANAPAIFPYVSFGPEDHVQDDAECISGTEITIQIDAWSQAVGRPEVKKVAEAVRSALHNADLPLSDNALVSLEHRQTRLLTDPDGLTSHAALEFVAFIEQP